MLNKRSPGDESLVYIPAVNLAQEGHNEKADLIYCNNRWNYDGIVAFPWECFQFFNRIEKSITFAVTIVIQISQSDWYSRNRRVWV